MTDLQLETLINVIFVYANLLFLILGFSIGLRR